MAITIESLKLNHQMYCSPMGRHAIYDSSNNLWIAYCLDGSFYLRKSIDGGSTWESGIVGYTYININIDCPQECAINYDSGNNRIYAIYHTCPEEKVYARSFNVATESWNGDQTELTGLNIPLWNIVLDRDYNGKLWFGYVKYLKYVTTFPTCTYYVRRSNNNDDITSWGADITLANSSGSYDGFGQLSIHCQRNGATDKVIAIFGQWTASADYRFKSRLNDGLGNGAGNWGSEVSITVFDYSPYLSNPLDYSHYYNFRSNPFHSGVRESGTNFFVVIAYSSSLLCYQLDWGAGTWTGKDTCALGATSTYQCACCVGYSTSTIRAFVSFSASLRYTEYDIATNLWRDTATTLEGENPIALNCTEGMSVLNDNRVFYQTKSSALL